MPPESVAIVPLQEAPGAVSVWARWLNHEWGQAEGHSLMVTTEWLQDIVASGSGKAAFMALDGKGFALMAKPLR